MLKKHDVSSLLAATKIVVASQHKSERTKEELSVYQAHIQPSYRVGREFQSKGQSGWTGASSFVLEIPLCNLRPSTINSVPCDRIVQRACCVNLHGAARLRNNFCQEKNYITFKNSSWTCQNRILKEFYIIPSMFWDVWKRYGIFDFQSLVTSVLLACSPGIRNYNCKSKILSKQLSNTS